MDLKYFRRFFDISLPLFVPESITGDHTIKKQRSAASSDDRTRHSDRPPTDRIGRSALGRSGDRSAAPWQLLVFADRLDAELDNAFTQLRKVDSLNCPDLSLIISSSE